MPKICEGPRHETRGRDRSLLNCLTRQELDAKILKLNCLQQQDKPDIISINNLKKEIDIWLEKEDFQWQQWAKTYWYNYGNKNTKFFHACDSQR